MRKRNFQNKPRGQYAPDLLLLDCQKESKQAAEEFGNALLFDTMDDLIMDNAESICSQLDQLLARTPQENFEERLRSVSARYKRGEITLEQCMAEYDHIITHRPGREC